MNQVVFIKNMVSEKHPPTLFLNEWTGGKMNYFKGYLEPKKDTRSDPGRKPLFCLGKRTLVSVFTCQKRNWKLSKILLLLMGRVCCEINIFSTSVGVCQRLSEPEAAGGPELWLACFVLENGCGADEAGKPETRRDEHRDHEGAARDVHAAHSERLELVNGRRDDRPE